MRVRTISPDDREHWARMREALWPTDADEHADAITRFFAGDRDNPAEVLVGLIDDRVAGFVELSVRSFVDGCTSSPVAYLEGWWVDEHARRSGLGSLLMGAAEDWGRAQGCTEFGSDAEIANEVSQIAHAALGFEEVARVVLYRKRLDGR